ncbi:unnamed protein product [Microthlaspi erraticum]|uniref:Uncharacterized protein n=1 Tax=Microthlaspi erraticum TaxID=1685480 RepID=A0A6D2HR19_9BRAS|nr:unnamed protein product [Microthlaspi erraticum]
MRVVVVLGFERWFLANLFKKASLKSIHDSIVESGSCCAQSSAGPASDVLNSIIFFSKRLQVGCFKVGRSFFFVFKGMVLEDYPMKVVVLEGLTSLVRSRGDFEVVCGELASPL